MNPDPRLFCRKLSEGPSSDLGSEKVLKGVSLVKGILATGEGGLSSEGVAEEMAEDPAASLYCFDSLDVYYTGTGFLGKFRKVSRYHDGQIGTL